MWGKSRQAIGLTGTRAELAQLLLRQGNMTVATLARDTGLAPATVRRHLDILQRDGLVTYDQMSEGVGRPSHVYRLSEQGLEALPGMQIEPFQTFTEEQFIRIRAEHEGLFTIAYRRWRYF